MTEEELVSMPLHTQVSIHVPGTDASKQTKILRVSGGWLYNDETFVSDQPAMDRMMLIAQAKVMQVMYEYDLNETKQNGNKTEQQSSSADIDNS